MAIVLTKYISKKGVDVPYLYTDKNGFFWVRKRVGDSTPRRKLDTKVESVAMSLYIKTLNEIEKDEELKKLSKEEKQKLEDNKAKNLLFCDFYERMIRQKKAQEIKPSTINRIEIIYEKSLKPFWANLSGDDIATDREIVEKFITWHKANREGIQFVNVYKYLGNILRVMREDGAILEKDCPKFELSKSEVGHHKQQKGRFITHDEYLSIEEQFDDRFKLILQMAYYMGMRKMEIGSLACERVIKKGGNVLINLSHLDTKTGLERVIPVPERLAGELWKLKKSNKAFIFQSPSNPERCISSQVIDKCWIPAKKEAGIEGRMRFHDTRHSAASNMVKLGVNPIIIATFLGMTIKTLQERYLKLKPEDLLIVNEKMLELTRGVSR